MNLIFKICPSDLWHKAEAIGRFNGAPVDHEDGYIHFSTGIQVRETADRHFSGEHNLILIAVDADALGDELYWEASRGGALFPHLYGDLDLADVVWTRPLPLGPDGYHEFPEEMA
ncbi:MAG: DUF952 domain-containing protein [Fimbriimonadaceae bacterium]|nr:DUF952 domain-containing protein [Alphaproteobacteria bacterium]